MVDVLKICREAKSASADLALADTAAKDKALTLLVQWLRENIKEILTENDKDIEQAKKKGLSEALIDRLRLTPERINAIAVDLEMLSICQTR